MVISARPAKRIAIAAMVLTMVFFVVCLLIGLWSGFFAVYASSWLFLGAGVIWLVLAIQFHQRSLAEQEKLDMAEMSLDKASATIFEAEGERAKMFAVAQRRLGVLEKWFLPIFGGLIAVYQAGMGLYLFRALGRSELLLARQPLLCAVVMMAIAFAGFLISRYATGMSAQVQWKALRAGGSFLFGSSMLCFALAVGLALVQFKMYVLIRALEYAIPVVLIVLGTETGLNVILDIYRPRVAGTYSRAAFDSRLLGLINEPSEILHTAAGAIDYQFGFKVSQTWFYRLLEKAILPLALFGMATLYFMTCIVVVNPNEEAIIEHLGSAVDDTGKPRLAGPGLAWKWPWPFDTARRYPTKKIGELYVGYVPKVDPKTGQAVREPLLWGKKHFEQEYDVLVASRQNGGTSEAAPVGILKANVPVQYRVKDLYAFLYSHGDYTEPSRKVRPGSEKRLEEICYRQLARYAAGATIETESEASRESSLLGAGRATAKKVLMERIQQAADEAGLGVEIVFVGIQGVHPPPDVAKDYEAVVGAVQRKQAALLSAQAASNWILSTLAGSVEGASALYSLASQYQQAAQANDEEKAMKLAEQLDIALGGAEGSIFAALREAQSYAFEKATLAKATGERFESQVKAHSASPQIYREQQRLTALEEGLRDIRKFVVVADPNAAQVHIVDLQEKLTPSLYELGGLEETTHK